MFSRLFAVILTVIVFSPAAFANDHERRIIGDNDLDPIRELVGSDVYRWARGVARVERASDGMGFCTASRIGRNLFLTNHHCYEAVACSDIQFTFGYESGLPTRERQTFKCTRVIHNKLSLDFAIFEAKPTNYVPYGTDEYPIMTLWAGKLEVGMPLAVASHPRGRLKEIDVSSNCVLASTGVEFQHERNTIKHTCDTESGSSGSPVLDRETGYVIGLHWGGTSEYNFVIPMHLIVSELYRALPADILDGLRIKR